MGEAIGSAAGPIISAFLDQYLGYPIIFIMMGGISLLKSGLYFCYK